MTPAKKNTISDEQIGQTLRRLFQSVYRDEPSAAELYCSVIRRVRRRSPTRLKDGGAATDQPT